jgi:competence protein ComEC
MKELYGKTGSLLRQHDSGVPRPTSIAESEIARERRLWPRFPHVEPLRFRRSPLLFAAIAFALGATLGELAATPRSTLLYVAAILALAAFTLLALRQSLRLALLPILALWLAAGLWSAQLEPAPPPQTALLAYADGLSRTIDARVTRIHTLPPRTLADADTDFDSDDDAAPNTAATQLDLSLGAIEDVTPDFSRMVPMSGGIRATLYADKAPQAAPPQLHCGDLVELPVRLHTPERYRDPGAWQYADYLLDQGIAATASLPAATLRTIPASAPPPLAATLRCHIFAAQSWASDRLLHYGHSTANRGLPAAARLSPDDVGMLNAMLFGDRTRLTHTLRLGFERTGSFHLFVVSGMHVALLAGMLFWLMRRLRLPNWLATLLTLALISAYALLTGFGVPVQRALWMTAVFLLARLFIRDRNPLNALGAAALAVLIAAPHALFEASFQMTFLAIVAIAGIAMPLAERSFLPCARATRNLRHAWRDASFPPRLAQFRVLLRLFCEASQDAFGRRARNLPAFAIRTALFVAELALIGVIAEAVMVLPMAIYFHRATAFALPANLLSIPLVGILAPLGLATFLAALVSPWLAALPGSALALLLHAVTGVIGRISHAAAADLRVPTPRLAAILAAVACIAFGGWAVRRSRAWAIGAITALALAAACILWPEPPAVTPGRLEVTAIDVGQGDSLLVVAPNGQAMLVDAGGPTGAAANAENAQGSSAFDVGEEVVSPYLWSRQIRRLDVIALSHAHSDHMGGMPAALRNFRPRELWVAVDPNSAAYRALLAEAVSLGIRIRHLRAGDRIPWQGVDISVLAPTPAYSNPGPPINNDSLVLRLQFGQASALLEGDAESPSEHLMAAAALSGRGFAVGPDTLLKVGHHGSLTSTTPEFLALAAPQDAVISVGKQNTFGHPRAEILTRLAAAHARTYRTDQFGLTSFLLARDGTITSASAPE